MDNISGPGADEASSVRTEFLSRMSHEIRTPMNAIIGMTRIARDSEDINKIRQCLDRIDQSSKQLLDIINDMLDMSNIAAHKLTLKEESFSLEAMLLYISNSVMPAAEGKRLSVQIQVEPDVPKRFYGDEERLAQVVLNLMSNAIKFTDDGTVHLKVVQEGMDGDVCTLRASIKDTGIGMSLEQRARLFKVFEQGDGSISRKYGGTGLGLAISKSLVEMMGGSITCESEPGRGSTFTFTVRLKLDKDSGCFGFADAVNRETLNILMVDDNKEDREYFLAVARSLGVSAVASENGDDALHMMRVAQLEGKPYNIVIVDWRMPRMSGGALIRRIRERFGDLPVIVVLSAADWAEIERGTRNEKVRRILSKPLLPSVLVSVVSEVLGETGNTTSESVGAAPALKGRRLLVVEDLDINREIIQSYLEGTKAEVECADNGVVALEKFKAAPEAYDLILMDVHMPIMDGYEATRHIRALDIERARTVPIIAMTANSFPEDIEKCRQCGMNDHVTKPVGAAHLMYVLSRHLPSIQDKTAAASAEEHAYGDLLPYLDVREGLLHLHGNEKLYTTLLGSFRRNTRLDELEAFIECGDLKAARSAAQTMKGIAGNLAFKAVSEAIARLENQLLVEQSTDIAMEQLRESVIRTLEAIARYMG